MPPEPPRHHLRASDIRGIAQLATQAIEGVTDIVEGVHQSVWSTMGVPGGAQQGRTRGITGLVYRTVRGVTQVAGKGVDTILAGLKPLDTSNENDTPQRTAVVAVMNGVMGDRLAAAESPLAIPMTFRYRGAETLPSVPAATGKVLLLIHGLCMTDLQWHTNNGDREVDHGESLAGALGYTPIHLRYNSGRHISENGRELCTLLEQLVNDWPTALKELSVVAHSMGGLLIRSAVQIAGHQQLRWPGHLKNIVFLGTPHHGSPVEQIGNWVGGALAATPYTAPFTKLADLRSAGITDLRHGHLLDRDWQGRDRFSRTPDRRQIVPLPEDVACYAVAATTAAKQGIVADRIVGDGLVPLRSALGQHDDPKRCLGFAEASQQIEYQTSHMGLLSSPEITGHMARWLAR
jgi:hypothetical protein